MVIVARYSILLQKSIIRKKCVSVSKYRNRTDINVFSGIPHCIKPILYNRYLGNTNLECSMDMESRNQENYRARGAAKRAIFKAKEAERKKFCEDLEGWDGKGNVFTLAKQLVSKIRDVVSASCVKNDGGKMWLRKTSWWESGEHIMIRY